MKSAYAQDGVDVAAEAEFSAFAGSICKASYHNSPFVKVYDLSAGQFRGPRPFIFQNLPEGFFIEATTDGIGTKGSLIDAAGTYHLAANDLLAMIGSDITRYGGIPLVLVNALDIVAVSKENNEVNQTYKKILQGLGEAARQERIVLLKGETAQMGICVGSDNMTSKTRFNWTGTMIGAFYHDKVIIGESLVPGQIIMALKEKGFRCNGITAVRAALKLRFGDEWWQNPQARTSIQAAATPSVLYDNFLTTLHGWFAGDFKPEIKIHCLAHLSGGGIKEKLFKDILLPRKLSAELDSLWEPPIIMRHCGEWRKMTDEEFYATWNGGQGMLAVIDKTDADFFVKRAKDFGLEAKIAGRITKESQPKVSIISQFNKGKLVIYQ